MRLWKCDKRITALFVLLAPWLSGRTPLGFGVCNCNINPKTKQIRFRPRAGPAGPLARAGPQADREEGRPMASRTTTPLSWFILSFVPYSHAMLYNKQSPPSSLPFAVRHSKRESRRARPGLAVSTFPHR